MNKLTFNLCFLNYFILFIMENKFQNGFQTLRNKK